MTTRILIIGGYGNFGTRITQKLCAEGDLQIIIAGRSAEKCKAMAEKFAHAPLPPEWVVLDIHQNFRAALDAVKPSIVIHTSGPFQTQGYDVAEACIDYGCHYIDLADGRDFVCGIQSLHDKAVANGVAIISGASSVPCLTSAIIDQYISGFDRLTSIDYGITTAQRTNTGLATTEAVLGYAGKPFATKQNGKTVSVYGWQGLTARRYPQLGWRLLGNCDIPDLALFPERYPLLENIRFRAGIEIPFIHLGLWAMTWLVRARLIRNLAPMAKTLLALSRYFDSIGTDNSAFHMEMSGTVNGIPTRKTVYLIAKSGHGPFIPTTPAILCAQRLARGQLTQRGAMPCVGLIDLESYLEGLADLDIVFTENH